MLLPIFMAWFLLAPPPPPLPAERGEIILIQGGSCTVLESGVVLCWIEGAL